MMWATAAILIGFSLLLWIFLVLALIKQYRFATLLTDLLSLYIPLTVLALISYSTGLAVIIMLNSDQLRPFPYEIIYVLFGMIFASYLIFSFKQWQGNYSIKLYGLFLDELKKTKYSVKLFSDYKDMNSDVESNKINIYLRHDVDLSIPRLLKLIKLEKERGLFSTLFFRLHSKKYSFTKIIPIIKRLAAEGFEIGYHYEVLSQTKGNTEEALNLFTRELIELRNIAPVKVVSHHGDKYSNHKIWPLIDKEKLDVWSAYDMKRDMYITDAGGNFMTRSSKPHIFDLLEQVKPGDIVQILIHADWWS
ncbi:MAG: hypothetical protein KAS63_02760 [Candidatus Heimdallarchaeota archaeon]|nr:hypothetical protein [Candidatus Heimdallarchaeota archaeon]MCK4954257.1 hypothetical protein [Candidatus Heimdallarchaeota archaeon]